MRRSFAEALKIGSEAERLVAEMLPGYVVHTAQATRDGKGGGKLYYRDEDAITTPDLQHFYDGKPVTWFEVKWKSEPVLFRIIDRYRHGVDYKNFVAYEKVAFTTKCDVWIVIQESKGPSGFPPEILAIDIEKARIVGQASPATETMPPMIYWNRDDMVALEAIEPCGGTVLPARTGIQGSLW